MTSTSTPASRIASLDLIRGVAVLGILAVNIAGFAGPPIATETPWLPHPASAADVWSFAGIFLVFEGKMRALFSMLFGASMLLFITSANANGRNGDLLQIRRLLWLLLIGYLHYLLLWWGDILFLYAAVGCVALAIRRLPIRRSVRFALIFYVVWNVMSIWHFLPDLRADEHVRLGIASAAEIKLHVANLANTLREMQHDLAIGQGGFVPAIVDKLTHNQLHPLFLVVFVIGETLPLMLIGMALYRTGFFSGTWPRKTLIRMATIGIALGGALTTMVLIWAIPRHFPIHITNTLTGIPRLMMALGYAAALMLAAPKLLTTWIGDRLAAAGRMAFSNYLGTTMLMSFIFNGWGFGLFNTVPPSQQFWFVALGWALMLAWSKPWLTHFHQGPLEWGWRSLTEWRLMPMFRRG